MMVLVFTHFVTLRNYFRAKKAICNDFFIFFLRVGNGKTRSSGWW